MTAMSAGSHTDTPRDTRSRGPNRRTQTLRLQNMQYFSQRACRHVGRRSALVQKSNGNCLPCLTDCSHTQTQESLHTVQRGRHRKACYHSHILYTHGNTNSIVYTVEAMLKYSTVQFGGACNLLWYFHSLLYLVQVLQVNSWFQLFWCVMLYSTVWQKR